MANHYDNFRQHKASINEARKSEYSERTLKYFNMLTEMLEREAEYGSSFPYLESVYSYIEKNEFISDKQCEIIDRIADHPESSFEDREYDYQYNPDIESPF